MVSQARVSGATSNLPQEEIATLQVWQDNKNLPTQVRNFARKPQQHLVNDADAMDDMRTTSSHNYGPLKPPTTAFLKTRVTLVDTAVSSPNG